MINQRHVGEQLLNAELKMMIEHGPLPFNLLQIFVVLLHAQSRISVLRRGTANGGLTC
jgi:hypothetical protein